MKVITTLAERNYFLGLAALLNSVIRFGPYVDKVIVGYRGELPDWLPKMRKTELGETLEIKDRLIIDFVKLTGNFHMVHEKPGWMRHVRDVLAPDAREYYFFDSDIVIDQRMSFYGEWIKQGIAICGDVNFIFNQHHPHRSVWAGLAKAKGAPVKNHLDGYYNSGFLGWSKETNGFIDDWNAAFDMVTPHSGDIGTFRVYDRTFPVFTANQDSLNLATMITDQPLALIGPEAMGFQSGMRLMHHPIGKKPWSRSYFLEFLNGRPPRASDIAFWKNINGEALNPVSPLKAKWMVGLCSFLRLMGRFYKAY